MSVYPIYLVLGSDGSIGAYAREDILKCDLVTQQGLGYPARQVFKLHPASLTITYVPTPEYAEFTLPIENLCDFHKRAALPQPTTSTCAECVASKSAQKKRTEKELRCE